MDYFKIVLDGYINDNNRKYLAEYFVREQKKASKEYYSADEFFSGCNSIVQQFTAEIKRQLYKEKNNCYFAIDHIKNRKMNFSQPDSSLTYEEQCEKALKIWEEQLKGLSIDNFSVNLFSLNNGYSGHLWNKDLLFISDAIENAQCEILKDNNTFTIENKDYQNTELVESIIKGIKELQSQDENAECIKIVKRENRNLEAPFRNWFKTFFASKYEYVNAEPEKGNGRIDLKIEDGKLGTVIIEFKGWWNNDKKQVIKQITSYLTDFESEGYIIIINNKRSNINEEYFKLIKSETTHYLENSYEEVLYKKTEYRHFKSRHKDGIRTKTLYHFILNVYC
jgi:hypothetical protein